LNRSRAKRQTGGLDFWGLSVVARALLGLLRRKAPAEKEKFVEAGRLDPHPGRVCSPEKGIRELSRSGRTRGVQRVKTQNPAPEGAGF
jgi:hypothetical protein